jgi:hypothetical protein
MPLIERIRAHVLAAERIHADDTPVPVLAKGKCRTGRLWVYVRDDRPFGGKTAPAAALFYSGDRAGVHPEQHLADYAGLMQADAYAGFNKLYAPSRPGGPIVEAMCWAHYLECIFMWSRRRHRQHPLITAARQTPHNNRVNQSAWRKARRFGLGFHGLAFAGPIPECRQNVSMASRFI